MNPLTRLAALLTKTKLPPLPEGENPHRDVLLALAKPLGEYLSDEFEDLDDLFGFLEEESILSEEECNLLRCDSEFCASLAEGLSAVDDDEDYYDEEDNYYNEEDTCDYSPTMGP